MTAPTPAPVSDVKTRLRAAAAKRAPTKRRATRRPTVSRNAAAAKKGKYASRIGPAIKSGAALLSVRNPVKGAILARQAQPFADALDRVAAEDPRVDAFLAKISGYFGKSGAWGELGQVTLATGGAMLLAGGTVPAGPAGMVLAFVAGSLVQEAARDAAQRIIFAQLEERYGPDPELWPPVNPEDVAAVAAQLLAPKATADPESADGGQVSPDPYQQDDGAPYGRDVNGAPHTPLTRVMHEVADGHAPVGIDG